MTTLLVTNDFPPRQGGIQTFLHQLVLRQPSGSVVVFASDYPGSAEFDAAQPFPVVRASTPMLLPTPSRTRQAVALARRHGADTAWFGAAAPLGLMAASLRRAGVKRVVATTHGHELGWAQLPVARSLLRRIGSHADVVTYLTEYSYARLTPVIPAQRLRRLAPGVDVDAFSPGVDGGTIRRRYGLGAAPVAVCVSRLVPRKGQDVLIRSWPQVRRQIPNAQLLIVGSGRDERRLRRLAGTGVTITGAVPAAALPACYAAGDVFAMPCRTRRGGLDVEGLGIVFLEASATGLPVVVGDSGGAPDAVRDGQTGYLVNGRDQAAVTAKIVELLADPGRRKAFGAAGRRWVEQEWSYEAAAARLTGLLVPGSSS